MNPIISEINIHVYPKNFEVNKKYNDDIIFIGYTKEKSKYFYNNNYYN